ncbi:MAG: type II toxin-antitoxin system HicB family antitoxin [Candidatus Electryonea clarkiae]|nr:type II toxin-antitoxin system HicB family antitoxin [Candidatus Electryonea clarkiae]MDP8288775.1 type II toxin-antitoxin system HicB family antitoxin [Candidatus Electryonea clarkiae]
MIDRKYTVLFKPDEDGGYIITVPALPGLVSFGETLREAKVMAKEAITGHLEALQKNGLPFPVEDEETGKITFADQVAVSIQNVA